MTEGINENLGKTQPPAGSAAHREARRALLKAAALAMPLIITLRGKPANAQQASLGSLGIAYGPMAYVNSTDIAPVNQGGKGWDPTWLGEAKNEDGAILKDKTRRTNATVADPKQPKAP